MSNFFDRPELKRNFFDDAPEPVRPAPAQTPQPKLTRTWGETAKDLGVGVVQGTANLLGGTAELANTLTGGLIDKGVRKAQGAVDQLVNGGEYREGPGITGAYTDLNKQLDTAKSPLLQRRNQELADTKGFFASAKKILTDPIVLSDQVAQQIPQLASMAGTARGTLVKGAEKALAKGATREAAEAAGRKSLERQLVAYSAVQEAGPSAMQARQEIDQLPQSVWDSNEEYRSRIAAGEDPAAVKESMSNVAALKAAGVGGAAGALGGKLTAGLEGRIFTRALDHAPLLSRQGAKELASTVGKEALEETIQEGGNQFGTNVGVQGVDATRGLMDGVPEAAGIGAALGGVIGGGMHVAGAATSPQLTRGQRQPEDKQDPLALPAPDGTPDYGTIRVTPDGTAITEPQRAGIDAQNEATGLTPDVEAARGAHPAAAPNTVPLSRGPRVPFEGAAPGSLADAINATSEAAQGAQVDAKTKALQEWHGLLDGLNGAAVLSGSPLAMEMDRRRARAIELGATEDELNGFTQRDALVSDPDGGAPAPARGSLADAVKDVPPPPAIQSANAPEPQADAPGRVPDVSPHAASLQQSDGQVLQGVRGARDQGVPAMDGEGRIPKVPDGLGAASTRNDAGSNQSGRELRTNELPVGDRAAASGEQALLSYGDATGRQEVDRAGGVEGTGASARDNSGQAAQGPITGGIAQLGASEAAEQLQISDARNGDAQPSPVGQKVADKQSNIAGKVAPRNAGGTGAVDAAAATAATSPKNDLTPPTEAQIKAGNYAKGHVKIGGLDISIENEAGTSRRPEWPPLKHHYGYLKGTIGKDKDHVDVFLTENAEDTSRPVFVVDQYDKGKFDEHKVVLGAASEQEAREAYLANYSPDFQQQDGARVRRGAGAITQMTQEQFKAWSQDPVATKLPAGTRGQGASADATPQADEPASTGAAIEEEIRPAGKKRDRGFTSAASVTAAITERGLNPADYEVTQTAEGGFIGKRKAGKTAAPKAENQPGAKAENQPGQALPNATAPEHVATGQPGVSVEEQAQIAAEFRSHIDQGGDADVTHIFDAPAKGEVVRLHEKARVYHAEHGWMTPKEARAKIDEWEANALKQGRDPDMRAANSQKIVLSLFDLSGKWSLPWEQAGYQVYRFDIQDGSTYEDPETGEERKVGDINNMSVEFFNDLFGDFDGLDIHAILAACPCTDFAVSGARHFAAKDADGRTVASIELVKKTLAAIEYFKPAVWALENPVGRIEKLTGLPPWRLSFDPNHVGDPYTKKTLIWGRFNADLPVAPVEPTEGSKMHRLYGGKSMATKNARSETPEGFAYAFFQANNAIDNPIVALAGKYDRLDRSLIQNALDAGVTPAEIDELVENDYYQELDDAAAEEALRTAAAGTNTDLADARSLREKEAQEESARRARQAKPAAEKPPSAPAQDWRERSERADAQARKDNAAKNGAKKGAKAAAEERAATLAAYFTPGNIVKSYSGYDEVLSYRPGDASQSMRVEVHEVRKVGDEWVRVGKPQDARWHSTMPDAKELKAGPIDTVPPGVARYTEPRADGQPFPNAPLRVAATASDGEKSATADQPTTEAQPTISSETGKKVPAKADKAKAKAEQAEAERTAYNDLLTDPAMVGKSAEDLAAAMVERAGASEAAAAKAGAALQKAIAKRAAEAEKERNRDPKVLLTQITERAAAAGLAEGQAFADFNAGFGHAMAGKTKSTLAGEGLADMLAGYKAAKEWLKTEEGRAYFEGRPARKLENTGADLRRHMDMLRRDAEAAKSDGTKLWEAIKKATVRATLFPITPPSDATPGATRFLEHARDELTGILDYLNNKYSDEGGHNDGMFLDRQGNGRAVLDVRVRSKYMGSRDERVARFLERILGTEFAYYRNKDAPESEWTEDRWDRSRKVPPLAKMTPEQQLDVIMGWVSDYISSVQRWHAALSKAKSAAEGVEIAQELIQKHQEEYRELYRRRINGNDRRRNNPLTPKGENYDYNTSYELAQIVKDDEKPLSQADRTKPLTWPRLDAVERDGMPDVRGGKDVTPQEAKDKLGFADIGFGTWVNARTDQDHLNYAFDAFMDLAKFMGLPTKMIGFDGKLHFTIGALGSGRHAAHFQREQAHPDGGTVPVINVTNTKGDGTVAHEWGHAFDLVGVGGDWPKVRSFLVDALRYLPPDAAKINEVAKRFLTGSSSWTNSRGQTRVEAAIYALQSGTFKRHFMERSQFNKDALLLDKGKGDPYWSNDKELIARSFEAFVHDTLGGTNTYLVNPGWVADGAVTGAKGYRGTPYPMGEDRKRIIKLWEAVRSSISVEDGKLVASLEKFKSALGDDYTGEGEARRQFLLQPANMEGYLQEVLAEREAAEADRERAKAERERKEREEADKAAAEALAALEAMAPPPPSETTGPLTEDDLSAIFDEAAAELREDAQEQPEVPPPGQPMRDLEEAQEPEEAPKPAPFKPVRDYVGRQWVDADGKTRKVGSYMGGDTIYVGTIGEAVPQVLMTAGQIEASIAAGKAAKDRAAAAASAWNALDYSGREALAKQVYSTRKVVHRIAGSSWDKLGPEEGRAMGDLLRKPQADANLSDAQEKTAAKIAAEAAKLGVEGLGEAMQGLVKLFGGRPGQLNSFPAGFDEDTYKAAKPHFKAALTKFQEAGKTLKDLFKFLIQQFGDGVKQYAVQFAKEEGLSSQLGSQPSASIKLADWVQENLRAGRSMDWRALFEQADVAFGGTQAEGTYTPKDAYDALEAGINRHIMANPLTFSPQNGPEGGAYAIAALTELLEKVPTQSKRTAETDAFQQFSTIPPLAYAANWVANVGPQDTMLEPSAGIGGLAVFAHNAGAKLVLNELSSRRAAVLQEVFPGSRVFHENAEQLDNILPADVVPSVVVMNPPFSNSAGRGAKKDTSIGAQHVEQALDRLADGGRLVAIVGDGMRYDAAAFRKWWDRIGKSHSIRAVLPISGKGYAKYGTTFDNVLLVIDKVAPAKDAKPLTTPVESYTQLIGLLTEIRNDRKPASVPAADRGQVERDAAIAERGQAAEQEQGAGESQRAGVPGPDGVGQRAPLSGQEPGRGRAGAGGARGTAGSRGGVRGADDAGDRGGANAGVRGGDAAGEAVGPDRRPEPADASGVAVEAADAQASGELTDSIFEGYQPQRLKVEGAKPHPGPLVQSAAMASVLPPSPTYTPNLPKATIEKGLLSLAQIEAVVYAGQAHSQTLPSGERRGFFIGDGTGVGKGREISGILLDNLRQGRTKAVWVSEKPDLMKDAQRDFKGVGGDEKHIFSQSKVKATAAIPGNGIAFTTYATLRSGAKGQDKGDAASKGASKSRIDQLVEWLGEDFDGVIAFDEAHNAGNAVVTKGKRGNTKPSEQALAVVELQKRLPNARVVYVSATGATEVSNLSYATRLGLWGEGTPFASVSTFINQMAAGGLANMELVARDMKQMGMYLARSLSFEGVTYSRLEHQLSPVQRDIYDRLSEAWQVVLQNFDAALEATGALDPESGKANNPRAVSAARSAFWGGQQRFFNQVITSMQMPAVLEQMEKDVAAGKALVLQLVNTNEAAQERALAKKKEEGEESLEDLDLTPRDQLMQMVEKSFPVVQMEDFFDAEGKKQSRAVVDSEGQPVLNKKAVAMRDKLLEDLKNIKVPDGPLEMVLNHFGPDMVAEVTGRSRRVVRVRDADGNLNPVIQSRGAAAARTDAQAFMDDKKQILIFSDAGGTGFSFHADRTQKNRRKRAHYLIQPGWRADKAVQGFGRTHRTNQDSAPHYYLAATDIPAHKRFLSSIARRLDQLGALTKGQRDTANQGMFSEKDNLESIYATQAIQQLIADGLAGRFPGFASMLQQMGLEGILDPNTGQVAEGKMPQVSKFLNRMLSLKLDTQAEVFDAFITRMEQKIETAVERGEFDAGLQTIKAISTEVVQDEVIYTDPRTKAETHFVELKLTLPNTFWNFPEAKRFQDPVWIVNKTSGKVYLRVYSGDETTASGAILPRYQLRGTGGTQSKKRGELYSSTGDLVNYEEVTEAKARELWEAENAARPATVIRPTYLITGAVLPIWDRLDTGANKIEVVRTQTADGKRLLGRQILPADAREVRKRFNVSSAVAKLPPLEVMKAILQGKVGELANGWRLQRAKVSDELRIEVKITGYVMPALVTELTKLGVISERINWAERLFIPVGPQGVPVLERLFENRPLVDLEEETATAKFSRRDPVQGDGTGQRARQVRGAIAHIVSRWGAAAPEVVVVDTAHDLPQVVRTEHGWQDVEGWYDDRAGTVYLVAGNLTSDERARRVLAHEAVGHYGIEAIVGEGEWAQIRDTVYRMMKSGAHPELFAELSRRYRGVNEGLFVREAVAVMAEKGMGRGVVNRVIAAIRRFLRGIGFDLEFSERELRDLIGKSARYLRNGRRPRVAPEAGQAMAFAARPDRDWDAKVQVVGIAGGAFGDTNAVRQARAAAKNYLTRLRDSGHLMPNADTGWKIGLSRASINELVQFDQEKLNLLIALPRITNVAVLADSAPNRNPAAQGESIVAYHTLYAPVALNGEPRIARLVVQEHAGGRYAFDLQQSSVLNAQGPAGVARFPGVESGARRPGEAHAMTVGQLRDAVNAVNRPGWSFSRALADESVIAADTAFVAGLSDKERQSPVMAAFAEGLWRTEGTSSPFFQHWFGESKVVDAAGNPLKVYHGTNEEFAAFDPKRLGKSTNHLTAALGIFTDASKAKAQHYAEIASANVPAEQQVYELYLSIKNPYRMDNAEFMAIDSVDAARAMRARLQREGFDGIQLPDIGQWVAFSPEQIKRTDNRGTFNPGDARMKFSRPDPEAVLKAMDARGVPDSAFDKLRAWWNRGPISSTVENTRPSWLGALTLRHLAELGKDLKLSQVDDYAKRVQQMATDRNGMQEAGAKVAEVWEKFQKSDRAGADATANLMHDTTIAAVDPSRAYVPLMTGATKRGANEAVTAESIARRIALVDAELDEALSEPIRRGLVAERVALEELLTEERARLQAYPELVRRYQALPEKGREVYQSARQVYDDHSKALRDAIIARVKDAVEDGAVREAYVMQVRQTFEDARVRGPYFPLARFGEFWINAEKDGKPAFFMYENVQEWRAGQTDLARRGYVVKEAGRKIAEARSVAGVSSAFMADLEGVLKQSGASKEVMDDVWQMYLRTLPDLSMRKHFIHRKKVEGYSGDALRAFSGNVFHGSYQIARVRHSHKLVELLDSLKKATAALAGDDPERSAKAAALTTELGLRHEWVMNPKDSKAVSWLTSLGFVWYLGATPAAAAVNLTQTAIVTFPVLAARFGVAKAWNTLAAATGRALRNVNGDLTRGLNDEERAAFALWEKSGAIDRTMAHNLAGLSETDTRSFNPVARRTMELVSLMFHKAEVVNREATALAAFRLARDAGQDFHTAVQYAADVITESHFDYTNANRSRWMQSNAAKVLLLFRQYSLNMTWLLWRNFYLGTKGETPAVRKEARKKLVGVLGMTALFAGVMGLPLMGLMFDLANAAAAAFGDDDDPFDAEVEFRNFLADLLGPDLARFITQGPIESLTGIEFGSRVGLNELWLRSPDRELEGQAMADYLLEQAAGPVVGGMLVNTMRGGNMIAEGNTWRGIETMAPKSVKDGMKALRYGKEGVNTMRGDPLIEDLSLGETLMQLAGFTPADVTERYDANSAAKNYEQRILGRRRALLNAYAMAWRAEDADGIQKALTKIQAWNAKHPAMGITLDTIRRSLASRMRYSARAESGVVLDRRIAEDAREQARFSGSP